MQCISRKNAKTNQNQNKTAQRKIEKGKIDTRRNDTEPNKTERNRHEPKLACLMLYGLTLVIMRGSPGMTSDGRFHLHRIASQ